VADQTLVSINPFNILGNDERGLTASFAIPREQSDFIYLTRKSGSLSGNSYHEGKNKGTSPKIFILLSGRITFSYRKIGDNESHSEEVVAPATIEVSPYVTHKVEALEDFVILECNSIENIQEDRVREEV